MSSKKYISIKYTVQVSKKSSSSKAIKYPDDIYDYITGIIFFSKSVLV